MSGGYKWQCERGTKTQRLLSNAGGLVGTLLPVGNQWEGYLATLPVVLGPWADLKEARKDLKQHAERYFENMRDPVRGNRIPPQDSGQALAHWLRNAADIIATAAGDPTKLVDPALNLPVIASMLDVLCGDYPTSIDPVASARMAAAQDLIRQAIFERRNGHKEWSPWLVSGALLPEMYSHVAVVIARSEKEAISALEEIERRIAYENAPDENIRRLARRMKQTWKKAESVADLRADLPAEIQSLPLLDLRTEWRWPWFMLERDKQK